MEALRPFYYARFSIALSPSGPAVGRRGTAQAAFGILSQRHPCMQPMKCVLDEKERRSLLLKETGGLGKFRENEAVENGKKKGLFTLMKQLIWIVYWSTKLLKIARIRFYEYKCSFFYLFIFLFF